jgi:iron complex transport system ATP-binding protein
MTAREEDERAVDDAMRALELGDFEKRRVDEPRGEQKRVASRALAQAPSLLLDDQRLLDVRHQLALYDLLVDLAHTKNIAIALTMTTSTRPRSARRAALLSGRVVAIGSVEDVLTYRRLRETFDADLYCGINDVNGARFFLPMRAERKTLKAPD